MKLIALLCDMHKYVREIIIFILHFSFLIDPEYGERLKLEQLYLWFRFACRTRQIIIICRTEFYRHIYHTQRLEIERRRNVVVCESLCVSGNISAHGQVSKLKNCMREMSAFVPYSENIYK